MGCPKIVLHVIRLRVKDGLGYTLEGNYTTKYYRLFGGTRIITIYSTMGPQTLCYIIEDF